MKKINIDNKKARYDYEILETFIAGIVLCGSGIGVSIACNKVKGVRCAKVDFIKEAIATLPQKERTIVEYRFYRNMQVKDIATQIGLSPSRVTRIVQSSLNTVREYLNAHEQYGY